MKGKEIHVKEKIVISRYYEVICSVFRVTPVILEDYKSSNEYDNIWTIYLINKGRSNSGLVFSNGDLGKGKNVFI